MGDPGFTELGLSVTFSSLGDLGKTPVRRHLVGAMIQHLEIRELKQSCAEAVSQRLLFSCSSALLKAVGTLL